MGCWDEAEARKRFEDAMRKKWLANKTRQEDEAKRKGIGVNRSSEINKRETLFDAGVEQEKQENNAPKTEGAPVVLADGFETLAIARPKAGTPSIVEPKQRKDHTAVLTIMSDVRSVRGFARQEYARIYGALNPFYSDMVRSKTHTEPVIFRIFREPEQQARMLNQLQRFANSDWSQGWWGREEKLRTMVNIFEKAVLREFEQGYEAWDVAGGMHRYSHVLEVLNGSKAAVELFMQKHPIFTHQVRLGNPLDCVNQANSGDIDLKPSLEFFEMLLKIVNEQGDIIGKVFPPHLHVFEQFLEKVEDEVVGKNYLTPLFDEARERSIVSYLKAVSGILEQCIQFSRRIAPPPGSSTRDWEKATHEILNKLFEPHADLYLQDELDYFRRDATKEVEVWEQKLYEQDATTENFYMSNVHRQADKKDFLTSFKKVVMMPVNVLPSFPTSFPFTTNNKSSSQLAAIDDTKYTGGSRTSTPVPLTLNLGSSSNSPIPQSAITIPEAPTDELAAKAAIMSHRLEGIKTLFSIEAALTLVHSAKTSLERAATFVRLCGQVGEEAREQCERIFIVLLEILGQRHVKSGFDRAVKHLAEYNPREVLKHSNKGVAPLVTFLELVNVGDLISQMIDVFYEQQLAATKLTDKNDFLDPAVKAKKKFEQMLDERVAAGLNKGIDVLMAEVEYVCATTQLTGDYNPPTNADGVVTGAGDIGPTTCAKQVVELVSSHTDMLKGSTDKNMLDVFNQEVGLRLFTVLCKHLKRQRISTEGAMTLISDMNLYYGFVQTLRNHDLLQYFKALRELSQVFLIGPEDAKEMAAVIADGARFGGILRAEEVYEFVERRADWFLVRGRVEKAMYGYGCLIM